MQLVPEVLIQDPSVGFCFKDDFDHMSSVKTTQTGHWAVTEDDGATGTDAVQNASGGIYRHYCGPVLNDEAYIHSLAEVFKLQANKHLWWEAKVTLTETALTKANFVVGLAENVGADFLADAAGGPTSPYDGMCWYKLCDNMFLEFETSLDAAQVEWSDAFAHATGVTYRLGAWCVPVNATTFTVYPWYSVGTARGVLAVAQAQSLTLTGHGEMQAVFGVKNGAANEEYIDIDYFWVVQER